MNNTTMKKETPGNRHHTTRPMQQNMQRKINSNNNENVQQRQPQRQFQNNKNNQGHSNSAYQTRQQHQNVGPASKLH